MSAPLEQIRTATDRIEDAETQLEELAQMVGLERLVRGFARQLFAAALDSYTPAEVARAVGTSRQAMDKRLQMRKRTSAQAGPSPTASSLDERNPQ
jgi:hypothetical protein